MKIREIISNDFDLDKCYPEHDSEQHSRYFNQTFWVMGNRGESGIMPSK